MKQKIKIATLLVATLASLVACKQKSNIPGYERTESGIHYKFDIKNDNKPIVHLDDVLVCELKLWLDSDTLFSNVGDPQPLLSASESPFYGSIEEGLLMMHMGDKATFAVEADSLAKYHTMPTNYRAGQGQHMYYEVSLANILSSDSMAHAASLFMEDMENRRLREPEILQTYLAENNITATPSDDGLYTIIRKKGNGPKIKEGSTVTFNYTGRLLDGTIFDSSVESTAQDAGIFDPARQYSPERFEMGKASYVRGLLLGLQGLAQGTSATFIIPSSLGYGSEWRSTKIQPYSTLIFDVDIVSVQ